MAKYRPSKRFLLAMGGMLPLGAALVFGLLPDLGVIAAPPIPGVIVFPETRLADQAPSSTKFLATRARLAADWMEDRQWDLLSWDRNPWKRPRPQGFGEHYFELQKSTRPSDQAAFASINLWTGPLYAQIRRRYPELAVPLKSVPDASNGFLKWLELSERVKADPSKDLSFPASLRSYLDNSGPWNPADAKAWLASEKAKVDEVRAIGLLTEQSIAGIEIGRYSFIGARHAKNCAEALLLEARLAAESGDTATALECVRAARGLADHFDKVETPSLLGITVYILLNLELQKQVLSQIIPALPSGQLDPQAWEDAVRPEVVPPSDFSRIMKGEWNVCIRQYLVPVLCDADDPHYPGDPETLVDFYSSRFVDVMKAYDRRSMPDWITIAAPPLRDSSHLSRQSRNLCAIMFVGEAAWCKGMLRAQYVMGMNSAAFAIMKGEAIPRDPIHGLPYVWDPASRKLSAPPDPAFAEMKVEPVTVPAP
ncbi:hypothetical protein [Luteolibacter luteus]|uniref:Uncharacterized protein n=1 Tax=Luteolibacter luteus TaxID=2728835 RepID=A0A858RPY2_9BACT|nr:hypothetical protein [Luteolibacter luteus]QJE98574.1 hypothetical protein HHL09_23250 [Luteolibacter luteus]